MFDTIKVMFDYLFELFYNLLPLFGYQFNKEEGKIEKIED